MLSEAAYVRKRILYSFVFLLLTGVPTPAINGGIKRGKAMCADMRKEGKRKAGVWLSEEEHQALSEAARLLGISKSDILKLAIKDAVRMARPKGENHGKQIG